MEHKMRIAQGLLRGKNQRTLESLHQYQEDSHPNDLV